MGSEANLHGYIFKTIWKIAEKFRVDVFYDKSCIRSSEPLIETVFGGFTACDLFIGSNEKIVTFVGVQCERVFTDFPSLFYYYGNIVY